jgi:hypothetical protein
LAILVGTIVFGFARDPTVVCGGSFLGILASSINPFSIIRWAFMTGQDRIGMEDISGAPFRSEKTVSDRTTFFAQTINSAPSINVIVGAFRIIKEEN